jgi:peptidoglycan/xylan/chitin deacetylase (PgdA/CDA1 family)
VNKVFPVLLYHSVSDHAGASWGDVSRSAFAAHVDVITASGREAVAITTLAAGLRGEHELPDRPVAITFDDGYRDAFEAVELLRERGLGATVFVTTGEIGRRDRLASEQIAELAQLPGFEIGAHAVHHRRLDELNRGELTEELHVSQSRLAEITGQPVDSFAYPYGAYDRRVRDGVIAAGYRAAAAVKNAISYPGDDPFAIARWTVTGSTTLERLAEVLEGRGTPLGWVVEPMRTRLYRSVRRARRRLIGDRRARA